MTMLPVMSPLDAPFGVHEDVDITHQETGNMPLPSGRCVEVRATSTGEAIRIIGANGSVELTVHLTEAGPKLVFDAADIELRARSIAVECERFDVTASEDARITAPRAALHATVGDVELRANDHVVVVGEQIRLNCDRPDTVPNWMQKALAARIARAADHVSSIPVTDITGDVDLIAKLDR